MPLNRANEKNIRHFDIKNTYNFSSVFSYLAYY